MASNGHSACSCGSISYMNAVDDFLKWAERDRNRSPETLRRYREVLDGVMSFSQGDPASADLGQIQEWWESKYNLSPATRANELSCLRAFYHWAIRFDLRIDDPTRRLDPPKVGRRLPRIVGRQEFEMLLGEATEGAPELRMAYALGGYGGLRVAEAAALDWADIDLEHRRIYVRGKGDKERPVPINNLLLDYLLPERVGNVLWGDERAAMSAAQLQRRINRHMKKWGVNHTYHDLRKRGASIILSKGANPVAVQKMFGWSSLNTVMHYAEVGDTELDRIAALLD